MTELFINWKTKHKVIFWIFVIFFGFRILLTILSVIFGDVKGNNPILLGGLTGNIFCAVIVYIVVDWFVKRNKK